MAEAADPAGPLLLEAVLDALETRLSESLRRDAAEIGLTEATARVLLALGGTEGLTMRGLASRIARDPSTVTRFVRRAADAGLVEQRAGEPDRRTRVLHLTKEGGAKRERLARLRSTRAAALRDGVCSRTGLGAEEVDWFLSAVLRAL